MAYEPLCSYARIALSGHVNGLRTELLKVPGVRDRSGVYLVPHHAIHIVDGMIESAGAKLQHASWSVPPPKTMPWEVVESTLRSKGEVREYVLDGFLTGYQKAALCYSFNRAGTHFWHPTGSGKTLTGILYGLLEDGPLLVVTRAASRLQFGREIERFTHLRPYIIRPESSLRKGAERLTDYLLSDDERRRVVVVGWESLSRNVANLVRMNPGCVIFDESHRGKSTKRWEVLPIEELEGQDAKEDAKRARQQDSAARKRGGFVKDNENGRVMIVPLENTAMAASKIAKASNRRVCTTATPIKDRVRDLWGPLDFAEPNAWGSATVWLNRYADRKPGIYGGYDTRGESNVPELVSRLEHVAHRVDYAETHRDLPPKRRQSVYVAPEDQCRPAGGFPKELKEAAKRGATALLEVKMAQSASKKRKAVIGLVEDHVSSNHKVVLFTGRRRDCDRLGEDIRKAGVVKQLDVTVWAAHGGVSTAKRQDIIDDYMAHPGPCVLVGTGDAFGESLNIHDTDAAIFVMLPYTPGQLRQWEGRFTRRGGVRPVIVYYVICEDTVDEHIADILISKLPAVESIVNDEELAAAKVVIAGMDAFSDPDALADSILAKLDF